MSPDFSVLSLPAGSDLFLSGRCKPSWQRGKEGEVEEERERWRGGGGGDGERKSWRRRGIRVHMDPQPTPY